MMRVRCEGPIMKLPPEVTSAELTAIFRSARRTASGCLLWPPTHSARPSLLTLDGQTVVVPRLIYAEHLAAQGESLELLETHEVIHTPDCSCPGDHSEGSQVCIEPSHLMLGTPSQRCTNATARRASAHEGVSL